jgi:hypothetical protein
VLGALPLASRRTTVQSIALAELRRAFLDACDRQQQVAEAARLAASHLSASNRSADFNAGFHMVQNLPGWPTAFITALPLSMSASIPP